MNSVLMVSVLVMFIEAVLLVVASGVVVGVVVDVAVGVVVGVVVDGRKKNIEQWILGPRLSLFSGQDFLRNALTVA